MEGIIWTDFVRNAEVLQKVKGERAMSYKKRKTKANSMVQSCMELPSKTHY